MIPFRVIRSGVLLTGLLAALAAPLSAASRSFTATLSPEQKAAAGLAGHSAAELAALDRLVAADAASPTRSAPPALNDPYALRYSEAESKEAGLDRLTPEQLAKLDQLITAALAPAPRPSTQPRERPRLRDDAILSEKGRLQVHGGFSLTYGSAGGGRDFHGAGAWVSYFDPVTGLGLSFSYSRYSGDFFPSYDGRGYYSGLPYLYSAPSTLVGPLERDSLERNEFAGDGASLRNAVTGPGRNWRR